MRSAHNKAYREKHRDALLAKAKISRDAHREARLKQQKAWREAHHDELLMKQRATDIATREKRLAKNKEYAKSEKGRANRRDYNARPEVKIRMRARRKERMQDVAFVERKRERHHGFAQGTLTGQLSKTTCDLCRVDCNPRDLHVDHDHASGSFRGMLCRQCNYLLGHVESMLARQLPFETVLAYIKKGSGPCAST